MSRTEESSCYHYKLIESFPRKQEIINKRKASKCDWCDVISSNIWLCLYPNCLLCGCVEAESDHSTKHFQDCPTHCLQINLASLRIWCYVCETGIFLDNKFQFIQSSPFEFYHNNDLSNFLNDSHFNWKGGIRAQGLTGLQNIGNTCYMNAALQALSNIPPLTQYFLECESLIQSDNQPGLSRCYLKLMQEMWNNRRPAYIVPSRFQQQDAQEFLRCFMDQLHEELKDTVTDFSGSYILKKKLEPLNDLSDDNISISSVDSDTYETCYSSFSEELGTRDNEQSIECNKDEPATNKVLNISNPLEFDQGGGERSLSPATIASEESKTTIAAIEDGLGDGNIFCDALSDNEDGNQSLSLSLEYTHYRALKPAFHLPSYASNTLKSFHSYRSIFQNQKKQLVKYSSIVSDVFDGRILSTVQCLTCNRISVCREVFQDLSLPIPNKEHLQTLHQKGSSVLGYSDLCIVKQNWTKYIWSWAYNWFYGPSVSLHDCLAAFFSADELKGDNMYSCERCCKLRNGMKYSKLLELPEVLCIHLKRFRHELIFSTKVTNAVTFPLEELDMSPYLHKDCPNEVTVYKLLAVICHHGNVGGGHYVTYAINHITHRWYEFDDQYVTEVSPETVQNTEAYVLFYKKQSEDMIQKRARLSDLSQLCEYENNFICFYISRQWLLRFETFDEPGPIDNSDFLCPHGDIQPQKESVISDLCIEIKQGVWEYLLQSFGGGPVCNRLYVCLTCKKQQEWLKLRQRHEYEQVNRIYNNEIIYHPPMNAISMSWFREWEAFVREKTMEAPGPVDNSPICIIKNNIPTLKSGSDYAQIPKTLWKFFLDIYGGGPELDLDSSVNQASVPDDCSEPRIHLNDNLQAINKLKLQRVGSIESGYFSIQSGNNLAHCDNETQSLIQTSHTMPNHLHSQTYPEKMS